MRRTYIHLIEADGCEAKGCRVPRRLCGIYRTGEGAGVLACSVTHAREADRRLSQHERPQVRRRS